MTLIQNNNLSLREIKNIDIALLFKWRNSAFFLENCTHRSSIGSVKEFKKELSLDFNSDRLLQRMIYSLENPIGTIFSYGHNTNDLYCFVTTFISSEHQNVGFGLKSFILFCNYHFETYKLFKIYADVYEYNHNSINLFKKKNISIEGIFKLQKLKNNERYDVYRFALYRSDIENLLKYCS